MEQNLSHDEEGPLGPMVTEASLLRAALLAAKNAYAPYSEFLVGAAVALESGEIVSGANLENAVYGLGICAEMSALASVSSAGKLAEVRAIGVVGYPASSPEDSLPTPPCGRCRQLILEAANVSGTDILVLFANRDLTDVHAARISELLPHAFDHNLLKPRQDSDVG